MNYELFTLSYSLSVVPLSSTQFVNVKNNNNKMIAKNKKYHLTRFARGKNGLFKVKYKSKNIILFAVIYTNIEK